MKKPKFLIMVLLLSWTTLTLGYVGMHAPGVNHECLDCHRLHAATVGPLLSTGNTVEEFCISCHNGLGPAGSPVGIHKQDGASGNGFTFSVTCDVCHNPHKSETLPNIRNIRKTIQYPSKFAGSRTVSFTSRSEYVLGNGTPGPWGPCEVCHTATSKHRDDGTEFTKAYVQQHYTKTWAPQGSLPACAACHQHNNSFWKDSNLHCVDCHNIAQGSRRAIVSEFSRTGTHFALAVDNTLDGNGQKTQEKIKRGRQCLVCHDMTEHRKGKVRLKDGDLATNVVAFTKFTSTADLQRNGTPPAGEATQDEVMNTHCLKCHDSSGASDPDNYMITQTTTTATNPFNTNTRADVDSQFTTTNDGFHPVKGYRNRGGAYDPCNTNTLVAAYWTLKSTGQTINCWDCHQVNGHGGTYSDMTVVQTWSDNPANAGFRTSQVAFCIRCHRSTAYAGGSVNNQSRFNVGGSYGSSHGKHYQKGKNIYECRSCHAGLVNKSTLGANGPQTSPSANPYKGAIHGYKWVWPAGSPTSGQVPQAFMFGGYLRGWRFLAPGNNGNTDVGTCYDAGCDHSQVWYNSGSGG